MLARTFLEFLMLVLFARVCRRSPGPSNAMPMAHLQITKGASMLRASMFAPMVVGFTTSVAVCAEDARQLTCEGTMIEPAATSQTTETVKLTLGRAQKVTLDLGEGAISARVLSNNKIQLKFRTKNFEGEYFHYTGDLFFIYKSGHLMRLTCKAG